ncbi:19879_t:CDS:2 [Cetraspora pellucida]|uniref:19879_t:CDS:1 n=1 Tax=Cetraspora pellucida TaxID=1433469 RepID=A0A9N9DAQ1_9GLOM|nr:19879_t:CDS:2 [Cetraspora pellucida]
MEEENIKEHVVDIVLCFDSPYFEDFTKILNPEYSLSKRTTLATLILNVEAANVLDQEPQIFDHASDVKNLINDRQFWIDIEQLWNILRLVKCTVMDVEFRTTLLADVFIELVKMAIAIQEIFKALEIWKKFSSGRTSADLLKTQMNLKRNEDHIKKLALKIHSISPHNAACEHIFSILEWYFGKRQTSEKDFFSVLEELTNELIEEKNLLEGPDDIAGKNSTNLKVENFINLLSKLEHSESSGATEEIVHGNKDFDVNDLL